MLRCFPILILMLGAPLAASAESRLDSFQKGLSSGGRDSAGAPTAPDTTVNGDTQALRARSDETDTGSEAFWSWLFIPVLYGGMESLAAVAPESWGVFDGVEAERPPGSTLIPFLRADFIWQSIDNSLDAYDIRAEAGFGPVAVQARRTWYDETGGKTGELQLTQVHLLYRMQFLNRVEVDAGVGPSVLDGESRYHALSFTLPCQVRVSDWLTAEFRPMWVTFDGSDVQDYELALHFTWQHLGLKAGYRWLTNEDESLEAPLLGLSVRW